MKHGYGALLVVFGAILAIAAGSFAQFGRYENPIKWRTYLSDEYCSIDKATTQVVNNEAEWQTFWAKLSGQRAETAPKDVDWMKEVLLVVTLGTKPTAGYSVYVEDIERTRANEFVVKYVEVRPLQGQILAQVQTSPFTIVRVEKTVGVPRFEGRTATQRVFATPRPICSCRCGCASCSCAR